MTAPVRFAILGTGAIASKHAEAIAAAPGAELAAVWGPDPDRGRRFAAEHGAGYEADIRGLSARSDIEAATVATPSGSHAAVAIPMLERGKGVLCEKPLDVTLENIDAMLAAARAHHAPLGAVLQLRLGAGARALKTAVDAGRFGTLALCGAYLKWWRDPSYYEAVDWRGTRAMDGGGALMNQGIHAVDLLQWLAGMPEEVFAFSARRAHPRLEVEDTIAVALRFPGGALGTIEASTACNPGAAMRIEIHGDRGSAVLEDDRLLSWEFEDARPDDPALRDAGSGGITGGVRDPASIGVEGHRALIADFAAALRGKRPPRIPGAEARNAVELILASYASARSGAPVFPPPRLPSPPNPPRRFP